MSSNSVRSVAARPLWTPERDVVTHPGQEPQVAVTNGKQCRVGERAVTGEVPRSDAHAISCPQTPAIRGQAGLYSSNTTLVAVEVDPVVDVMADALSTVSSRM